jgi:hypothetical protein
MAFRSAVLAISSQGLYQMRFHSQETMSFQYLAKPNLCVSPHNALCIFLAKGKTGICPEQEAENPTINKGIS